MSEVKERVSYFYEMDGNGQLHPKLTVAFVTTPQGRMGLGVALRSDDDQPSKGVGRTLALLRARAALESPHGLWGTENDDIAAVAIDRPPFEFGRNLLRGLRMIEGDGMVLNMDEWYETDLDLSRVWTWDRVNDLVIKAAISARLAS